VNLEEFFVTIGFNADTIKVKEFVGALAEMPLQAAAGIAALAGIDYQLLKIADEAINASVAFQMFGSQTGLSWQELQKWQIVAQQANVSADAVTQSVTSLQRQMAEIKLGRGNIAPFQILGIDPRQDAFSVLRQLRERLRGVEPAMATNLIQQMGIDPSMIQLLRLSNTEFEKLSKTVKGMTSGQEKVFLEAKKNLVQFRIEAQHLGIEVVAPLVQDFNQLVTYIGKFVTGLRTLNVWIPGVVIAAAALSVAFAPITAGIIALLLVLDDLATYFRGGTSVTGLAIDGIKKLGEALKEALPTSVMASLARLGGVLASVASLASSPLHAAMSAIQPATHAGTAQSVSHSVNQNVTVHVNSTAPAHDVAKEVKAHIDRAAGQAALQTNQQGY
jgi:hypothetical protein